MSQISRIRKKLSKRSSELNAVLTEEQVTAFEAQHLISLPHGYRRFLLEIGNGGIGPPCYGMYALGTLDTETSRYRFPKQQDLTRVSMVFPFTSYWVWEDGIESTEGSIEEVRNGSILLGTDGCGMDWHLIVSGPDCGIPWMISGEGIQPVCPKRDFLQWYEDWLDGLDHFYGFTENEIS
jgi:hypothetical protein